MKISCPTCSAKYSIADEKVQSRLAKIRCRKCGTSIVIDGNVSPVNVYAGGVADGNLDPGPAPDEAGAPESGGPVYTVDFGEGDQRQMSVSDLVAAYNAGTVTAQTYLWTDGFADWKVLGEVDEVVAALHAAAAPADSHAAAAQSTAPDETPWAAGPAAGLAGAGLAAAAPAAAAAKKPAGADLFGSYDRAGSEHEVTTSASAGLASGGVNPFAASNQQATTGARNESSVLFSLSALTSAATTSRPSVPAPSGPSTSDDSGLIDLRALTAAAEARPAAPVAAAPFGAPSPLGTPLASPLASPLGVTRSPGLASETLPPPKSNTGLFIIGGAIVVAAVAAAAVFAMMGKEDPAPPAPAAPTVAAAPTQTAAPLPTATTTALPAADAKPPATGTESEEAAPASTAKKPTTTVKKPTTTTSSGSTGSTAPAATAKPAAPAKSKCGCAANDLMCNMKCSSK